MMQPVLRWKSAVALVAGVFLIGCSGSDSESGPARDEGAADVAEGDTTAEDISAVEDSSTAPGEDASEAGEDAMPATDQGVVEDLPPSDVGAATDAATTEDAEGNPAADATEQDATEEDVGPVAICGDGIVNTESGEVCDDANTTTEASCDYGVPSCVHCNEDCSAELTLVGDFCGDGVLHHAHGETCDDGDTLAEDGCSATCTIEPQCTAGCLNGSDCASDEKCEGKPSSVLDATGQCAPKTNPAGVGESCSSANPCPEGLACLGEFIWAGSNDGFCVAQWQAKDFYSFDDVAIPDDGALIESSVVACGLATVPVDIVVTLHLDHPRPEDLLVKLEDPNSQQGTVLDHEPYDGGAIVTFVGSGDDTVNGLWTLHVRDTVAGEAGKLMGWSVYLLSNYD